MDIIDSEWVVSQRFASNAALMREQEAYGPGPSTSQIVDSVAIKVFASELEEVGTENDD